MTERELDVRLHAWMVSREPGTVPETLRASVAAVPYRTSQSAWSALGSAWADAFGPWRQPALLLLVVGLLLAALLAIIVAARPPELPRAQNGLFAFVGESGIGAGGQEGMDIFLVRPDGTGLRQLTSTAEWETAPAWSADGSRLAYLRSPDPALTGGIPPSGWTLVVADPATGTEREVYHDAAFSAQFIEWTPDGAAILVHWYSDGSALGVAAVDIASRAARPLASGPWLYPGPSLSPDGRWLAWIHTSSTICYPCEGSLMIRPLGPGAAVAGPVRQIRLAAHDGGPILASQSPLVWSSDSKYLIFTGFDGAGAVPLSNPLLWAVSIPLGSVEPLSAVGGVRGVDPAVSPDGSRIALLRNVSGPDEVWVMGADGTDERMVAVSYIRPRWSPDGTSLYLWDAGGFFSLDIASGVETRLTGEDFAPDAAVAEALGASTTGETRDLPLNSMGGASWQPVLP